jgi:hypothetical protein
MSFAYVIRSRKVRDWVVLAAFAIMLILIAAVFLLYGRSPTLFEMDDLYGFLD